MTEHLWAFVIQSPTHPKLFTFSVTRDNSQQHWHSIAVGIEVHCSYEHHSETTADSSNMMFFVIGIYEICLCHFQYLIIQNYNILVQNHKVE